MAGRFRWSTLLILLLFAACSGGGCPADPGGACVPGSSDCIGDFYCSVGGVCTKVCENDLACAPACETFEDCGGTATASVTWTCNGGACRCTGSMCPPAVACYDGFCQRDCAADDLCSYDPYEER